MAPKRYAARPRTQMASGAGQPQSTARRSRIPDPNSGCAHRTGRPHRFGTSASYAYPVRRHPPPCREPARPSERTNQSAGGLGSRRVCRAPAVGRSCDATPARQSNRRPQRRSRRYGAIRPGRRELDCDGQSCNRSIEQDQLKVNRLKGGGIGSGISIMKCLQKSTSSPTSCAKVSRGRPSPVPRHGHRAK